MGTIYTGTGSDSGNIYFNGYLTNLPTWPGGTYTNDFVPFAGAIFGAGRVVAGGSSATSLLITPATVTGETISSPSALIYRCQLPFYSQDNLVMSSLTMNYATSNTTFVANALSNNDPLAAFTNSQVKMCGSGRVNKSIGFFCYADKDNYYFSYFCALDNALYPSVPQKYAAFYVGKNTANNLYEAKTLNVPNSNVNNLILTSGLANYSFVCSATDVNYPSETHNTGNWVTDLALRQASDNNSIGTCSNLLLARGSLFEVGKAYSPMVGEEPDGNTANTLFMCVADWGTDKILMRIKDLRV